jgi:hypothetical protein
MWQDSNAVEKDYGEYIGEDGNESRKILYAQPMR